ncbi:MAG: TlpA family protein disulfide reductase [Bacteroidales bacterium]|jgi:thiol-disulfide isomerase/thioredoxin|nr:TlpA family protein disulfide reductase [Bacteroidales bacterium]
MRRLLIITLLLLLIGIQNSYSQKENQSNITINENTVVKDVNGNKIDLIQLQKLMQTGKYSIKPIKNSSGEMKYIQLIEADNSVEPTITKEKKGDIQKAPQFSTKDMNGNEVSTDVMKGKVTILNFWFTKCKPCIAEIPDLNRLYDKYKDNEDVVFASITFSTDKQVTKFMESNEIKYPVVTGAKDICKKFNVMGYPTTVIIDKEGNIVDQVIGGMPNVDEELSEIIDITLSGKKVKKNPKSENRTMIGPDTIFKNEKGEIIPFKDAVTLLKTNEYTLIGGKDESGEKFYTIKKK